MKKSAELFCTAGLFFNITFVTSLQAFTYENKQPTITLNRSNTSLEVILIEITKQTGYTFSAKSDLLHSAKPIDINVKNVALSHALDICFKNQPLTYIIKGNTIIIKQRMEITQD